MSACPYEWHPLTAWESSVWCDECSLPSAFRCLAVQIVKADPTRPLWRGWVHSCLDCGDEKFVPDTAARIA